MQKLVFKFQTEATPVLPGVCFLQLVPTRAKCIWRRQAAIMKRDSPAEEQPTPPVILLCLRSIDVPQQVAEMSTPDLVTLQQHQPAISSG